MFDVLMVSVTTVRKLTILFGLWSMSPAGLSTKNAVEIILTSAPAVHLTSFCPLHLTTDERDIPSSHKFYSHLSDEELPEEESEVCWQGHMTSHMMSFMTWFPIHTG